MGDWGYGNFDSDDSLNLLGNWIQEIIDHIREISPMIPRIVYMDLMVTTV